MESMGKYRNRRISLDETGVLLIRLIIFGKLLDHESCKTQRSKCMQNPTCLAQRLGTTSLAVNQILDHFLAVNVANFCFPPPQGRS